MSTSPSSLRLIINRDKPDTLIKGLYLITDQEERLAERVEQAINGGAQVVQYRNKDRDVIRRLNLGWEIKRLCSARNVPFIINDDLEMALELRADGLHIGQEDGDAAQARKILGPNRILGVSTHNLEEALKAQESGADYIGFGAMFPTRSKDVQHLPGPALLAAIREHISIPIVAIGGITRDNGAGVIDAGADALAAISAVLSSPDPTLAANELSLLFNRRAPMPRGAVLTVAGSDSGGGAGIQADIKTITLLGSYAAAALTALTAQNSRGVSGIEGVSPDFVAAQLDAVLSDIPIDVVKTGMLLSPEIVQTLAIKMAEYQKRILIVDPVSIAKGGAALLEGNAVSVMRERLLPLSYLITPNIPEAERLARLTINDEDGMQEAAIRLHAMGAKNVLIKGGHLLSGTAVDILYDGSGFHRFPAPRILTKNSHGTGCTLASAIATFLAQGEPLREAVALAKRYITSAIKLAQPMGKGHGPVNHFLAAREIRNQEPGSGDR